MNHFRLDVSGELACGRHVSTRLRPPLTSIARWLPGWLWLRKIPNDFVANGRVGPCCLRSTACSGSGSIDYDRAVWTPWCWSSRPPSSNVIAKASACFWRWRSRSGRSSADRKIRKLIREMSSANPLWGAPRIHGELLKLGIEISQATVAKYMARRRGMPSPTWRSFLRNQAAGIAAIDMFVVASASFRLLYVMIHLGPRSQEDHFTRPSPSIPPHLGSPAR